MLESKTPHKHPKPHPPRADCCAESECSTGLRNNYFVGKRLTPDAFQVEQRYLNQRRHLLNRAIHGWGVVYGYGVTASSGGASGRIEIGGGLALDRVGRELLQIDLHQLELSDMIGLDENGAPFPDGCKDKVPLWRRGCWLLSVHYAEQPVGPVTLQDPCSCERHQWDRVCETVRFSLRYVDCAACCQKPECDLCCSCGTGPCCDEQRQPPPREKEDCASLTPGERPAEAETRNPVLRGGCQCLCEHLTGLSLDVECQALTEIVEPCGRVFVDLHNGVPLACVRLTRDECGPWMFDDWIEPCGPRRLVKRNDVLFDLIRGCDLTRIVRTGWENFHRQQTPVPWAEFEHSWGQVVEGVDTSATDYWIEFSRPVRQSTIRPDCFAITVIAAEQEGGWGQMLRVPIIGVQTPEPDQFGHVMRAEILVDSNWVKDAILSSKNLFNYQDALVEVEVRGDYIIDCNGQAVDAEAVGLAPIPTGDGAPGGRYLSSFRVAARRTQVAPKAGQPEPRAQGGMS